MKKVALLCGVALVSLASVPALVHAASVKIVNKSDWVIQEFYLSPTGVDKWGPDQIGEEVIGKNESFNLKQIPCDSYDVRIVDEDEDECIIEDVDICGGSESWVVTNEDLLGCQAETEGE